MRRYDVLLMYPGTLGPEEVDKVTKGLFESVRPLGVEVRSTERWPKRRFAYEVKHHTEGYYCDVVFDATPEGLAELDRLCRLEDSVLRHKIVSLPEQPADAASSPAAVPAGDEG